MAFERPCLVFADMDGNIYDDPDFHMLAMDASGYGLPRPEEITPLPEHCVMALLPARYALGLDPATGETIIHEGVAVAAIVPDNYVVTGLPAAHTQSPTSDYPDIPPMPYAAIGFAHNRFYMCAKKIEDASRFTSRTTATKKIKKSGKSLIALYPENRLVAYLVEQCALGNDCWGAKNFCLGLAEMVLPINPLACSSTAHSSREGVPPDPTPEEFAEVMLHHARANKDAVIYLPFTGTPNERQSSEMSILKALRLFKQNGGKATTILHCSSEFTPALEPFAQAGLSGIHYTLSGCVDLPLDYLINEDTQTSAQRVDCPETLPNTLPTILPETLPKALPKTLYDEAKNLGLQRMLQYEYFPGISDTDEEMSKLITILTACAITRLLLGNFPNDPQKSCRALRGVDKGPVAGFGNFFKRIKKECPDIPIASAIPFCKSV